MNETTIRERAATAAEAVIETGARLMVAEKWRIVRALYPWLPTVWPVEGKTLPEIVGDCDQALTNERNRIGHWTHDPNRHIALRQASRALTIITTETPQ